MLQGGATLAQAVPDVLLEWRRWRRPPADRWGLGAAVAAAAAAGPPQPDPAELARCENLNAVTCASVCMQPCDAHIGFAEALVRFGHCVWSTVDRFSRSSASCHAVLHLKPNTIHSKDTPSCMPDATL